MYKLKKFMPGALFEGYINFSILIKDHGSELKLISLVAVLCLYFSGQIINSQKNEGSFLFDMTSVYKLKMLPSISPVEQPAAIESHQDFLNKSLKINVKKLISSSMNYSYSQTDFSFFAHDNNFFEDHSKAVAEEKILTTLPTLIAIQAQKYLRAVLILSQRHQVDPLWVLSVMWTESHFNPQAKSIVGANGLMQLMPQTKAYVHKRWNKRGKKLAVEQEGFNINDFFPYRVVQRDFDAHHSKLVNIELGIIYLKDLLQYFESHKLATVAYNMGPTWTDKRLKNNLPVGIRNQYLAKVEKAYKRLLSVI